MYKICKIALSCAVSSLILNATIPVLAATVKFDLSFFDNNEVQVGDGQFTYDDQTTTCFETSLGIADCSLTPGDEFFGVETIFVQNTLTDFSATIDGFDWDGGFPNWWGDEASGQAPGHQSSSRTNITIQENRWFFGDPFMGERQMTMDIDEFSDTFGQGSWGQSVVLNTGFIEGSGTWQATRVETTNPQVPPTEAVPEPSTTIPAVLISMGLAYASRKKQIRKIYHNIK